jgi:hypothetical protein
MKILVLVARLCCLTKIALGIQTTGRTSFKNPQFGRLGISKSSEGTSLCPPSVSHLLELTDPLSDKVPKPDLEKCRE